MKAVQVFNRVKGVFYSNRDGMQRVDFKGYAGFSDTVEIGDLENTSTEDQFLGDLIANAPKLFMVLVDVHKVLQYFRDLNPHFERIPNLRLSEVHQDVVDLIRKVDSGHFEDEMDGSFDGVEELF